MVLKAVPDYLLAQRSTWTGHQYAARGKNGGNDHGAISRRAVKSEISSRLEMPIVGKSFPVSGRVRKGENSAFGTYLCRGLLFSQVEESATSTSLGQAL